MISASEQSGRKAGPDLAGIVFINGEEHPLPHPASVRGVIDALGLANRPVAVELNGSLVRRADREATALKAGDRVEIVSFVGGG